MTTINFNNVYLQSTYTIVGPKEYKGPLKAYFHAHFDDIYLNQKTYEKAEMEMIRNTIINTLKNLKIKEKDIGMAFGGDLTNQIACTNHAMKEFNIPFVGVYGACSTSMLSLALASIYVENYGDYALCFAASHNATSEKQFRFPNEYGVQKKPSCTFTVTGCGAAIVGRKPTYIKVRNCTIGRVVDSYQSDVNDLGAAMALAALDTLTKHLENTNTKIKDYDLILTGDLSKEGSQILRSIALYDNLYLDNNYNDCGLLIYDLEKQNVNAGGSGCGCCAVVTYAYVVDLLKTKKIKNALIIATGALFSPVSFQQEKNIPTIAHAITLEVSDL